MSSTDNEKKRSKRRKTRRNDPPPTAFDQNENANDEADFYQTILTEFAITLGCSNIDLDRFVSSLIDLTAICQSDWDNVPLSTNSPKKN